MTISEMIYILSQYPPGTRVTTMDWDEYGDPEAWDIENVIERWEGSNSVLYEKEEDRPFGIPVERIVVIQ